MSRALEITYPNPNRICDSAQFPGTGTSLTQSSGTAAADSKTGMVSLWFRFDVENSVTNELFHTIAPINATTTQVFGVQLNFPSRTIGVTASVVDADATAILRLFSTSTFSAGATWHHVLAAWDVANGIGQLYIDGVADLAASPTINNTTIQHSQVSAAAAGAQASGHGAPFNGCLGEIYYAPGQYLDISLAVNRAKFRSLAGKPVHLGTTGALPTGTAPLTYLHIDDGEAVTNFATNRGSGSNFTNFTSTTAIATGSTSPSD